jgi:hypothetical protein
MYRNKLKQSDARATVVNPACQALRRQIDEQLTPRAIDIPNFSITQCGNYSITMCG